MLLSPARAERILNRFAETITYYDCYLDQYPSVMVEYLDPLYQLAYSLAAFDAQFLKAQLTKVGGWRGVISGGLYALLHPAAELLDYLCAVPQTNHPENMWACRCAIAEIQKKEWPPDCRCLKPSINIIRDAVKRLCFPETLIRRELEADELRAFAEFREFTLQMYHEEGMDRTNSEIRTKVWYQWVVSHSNWLEEFAGKDDCESLYKRE